ncbi:hypothetical protein [Microbacterium sp. T2.11-28]|uniref:hypothetical protein n=1 Tax=Microbacterium sp. T2.11-28 TaxID=3041169 RepID=UPI0024775174|nr:hypothetical protein [Microbacterium sp. T2.11-28]CAI9385816.1 hypothetical protein MICABA_00018 [Microbacterium sp. T2.11-28]
MDQLWPQIIIAITTLVASLLGYTLAGLNDARRDLRVAAVAELTRAEERRERALEDRHTLQLSTLLELQDAVQLMLRLTGKSIHFDHMQAREQNYTQLEDSLDADLVRNSMDIHRLVSRVLDGDLRSSVLELSRHADLQTSLLPQRLKGLEGDALEQAALAVLTEFAAVAGPVMELLGEKIRAEIDWQRDVPAVDLSR